MNNNDYLIMNVISNICVYLLIILVIYLVFKVNNMYDKVEDLNQKMMMRPRLGRMLKRQQFIKDIIKEKEERQPQPTREVDVMTQEDNLEGETQTYVPVTSCNKGNQIKQNMEYYKKQIKDRLNNYYISS